AVRRTSSPIVRVSKRRNLTGSSSSPNSVGPEPASFGATKTRSLSIRPARANAVARVGPPSSSSDWTSSPARRPSPSLNGPELTVGKLGLDAGRPKLLEPAGRIRVRVLRTDDDLRHAGVDHRLSARRRRTGVSTRL